jgi:hypothetical protein
LGPIPNPQSPIPNPQLFAFIPITFFSSDSIKLLNINEVNENNFNFLLQ